jgi:hypothetical protein
VIGGVWGWKLKNAGHTKRLGAVLVRGVEERFTLEFLLIRSLSLNAYLIGRCWGGRQLACIFRDELHESKLALVA